MNDDTPVIHPDASGDTAPQPDAAGEAAPKKKGRRARKTAAVRCDGDSGSAMSSPIAR